MDWTFAFFQKQASRWRERARESMGGLPDGPGGVDGGGPDPSGANHHDHPTAPAAAPYAPSDQLSRGRTCYALRQEHMWLRLAERARDQFIREKQHPEV